VWRTGPGRQFLRLDHLGKHVIRSAVDGEIICTVQEEMVHPDASQNVKINPFWWSSRSFSQLVCTSV
jgi:hypothetical protein